MSNKNLIFTKIHNQELLNKAYSLANNGILKKSNNYYFLKLADNFIHDLYPIIKSNKMIVKPDYFSIENSTGAHITLAYEEENADLPLFEIGQVHEFLIEEYGSIVLKNKEYHVLIINSASLNALRIKYNLPLKPAFKNFLVNFHITIAMRFL